jgi:outer membrane protein OmpA-like peptidoglycan-associated protein
MPGKKNLFCGDEIMQQDKPVKKSVDPVIDQKIIKPNRPKWLLWLLLLVAALLIFLWAYPRDRSETSAINNADQAATQPVASDVNTGNPIDALNAWFNGDRSRDSQWLILDSLSFNSGSATPSVNNAEQLQKIADILNQYPDSRALIRGFADATGPQELNNKLSAERAGAVKSWLVQHNVKDTRLSIDGQGDAKPVASNATEQGREMNRRVAIKMLSNNAGG